MTELLESRKRLIGLLLAAFLMASVLPACSSSEEEESSSAQDEICDEADAGTQGCPD